MTKQSYFGKTRGLRRLATQDGLFTMVAMDQRPPIANLIAEKRGINASDVAFDDMVAVKRVIGNVLAEQASAVLLDPNYAIPAVLARLPARSGLVMTLEDHRFEDTPGGRLSHAIENWSVAKIKRIGGDGVKVLAWYRPDAERTVIEHQKAFIESIGEQCRAHDIPYILELLVYPFVDGDQSADYIEDPRKQPELVIESVREFAQPRYGVDLFKLESPLPGASLPAHDDTDACAQAQEWFNQLGTICREADLPWVMLSAGVTSAQFLRVMQYAYAAGANGFLAGRAIWLDAMQQYPDLRACEAQLNADGTRTFSDLADLTDRVGNRWTPNYDQLEAVSAEGEVCSMVRDD